MKRLKLTTTQGIEFVSPLVYSDSQAQAKLSSMAWLIRKGAYMGFIEVPKGNYIQAEVYNKDDETRIGDSMAKRIRKLAMTKGSMNPLNGTDEEEV